REWSPQYPGPRNVPQLHLGRVFWDVLPRNLYHCGAERELRRRRIRLVTFHRPSADPPKAPVGTWPLMAMFILAAALPVILSAAAAPAAILLALIAALLATGRHDRVAWWIV